MMAKVYWYVSPQVNGIRSLRTKWVPVDGVMTPEMARRLLASVGASCGQVIYGDCSYEVEYGRVTVSAVKPIKKREWKG